VHLFSVPSETLRLPLDHTAPASCIRYAKVEEDQIASRVKAHVVAGGDSLTRCYMLDEGDDQPVERKQLEIFKITRDHVAPPVVSPVDLVAVNSICHASTSSAMPPNERIELNAQLRQMVTLSDKDYRTALKQMWLLWHPDKNETTHRQP
jgi:hypothetical protein